MESKPVYVSLGTIKYSRNASIIRPQLDVGERSAPRVPRNLMLLLPVPGGTRVSSDQPVPDKNGYKVLVVRCLMSMKGSHLLLWQHTSMSEFSLMGFVLQGRKQQRSK